MRFGKKLALQVRDDASGAPYLSHKPMKEAINRTVRELRGYQARLQHTDRCVLDDNSSCSTADVGPPTPAEIAEMEGRITAFDRQLFAIVDDDIDVVHTYVCEQEARMTAKFAQLQRQLMNAGLLMDEAQVRRLETLLPAHSGDRSGLCKRVFELRVLGDAVAAFRAQQSLAVQYNALVDIADLHTQYLEINVAGFRKLLKRHQKQIPQHLRARPGPVLGFHKLVTRKMRSLLEAIRRTKAMLMDAREAFEEIAPIEEIGLEVDADWVELDDVKGFGPECETVVSVKQQLKDPMNRQLLRSVECLYPKPGSLNDGVLQAPQQPSWAGAAATQEQAEALPWPGAGANNGWSFRPPMGGDGDDAQREGQDPSALLLSLLGGGKVFLENC